MLATYVFMMTRLAFCAKKQTDHTTHHHDPDARESNWEVSISLVPSIHNQQWELSHHQEVQNWNQLKSSLSESILISKNLHNVHL